MLGRSLGGTRLMVPTMLSLALLATGCAGSGGAETTITIPTTLPPSPTTSTTVTATTVPITTTTTAGPTTTTLPGEPMESGPTAGDVLGVVAVAYDDVLNLRAGPGTDFDVLKKMAARSDRVIANGRTQELPNSIWYEVTFAGVTGWATSSYLAYSGPTEDLTSSIVTTLGETPAAETMAELGQIVTEAFPPIERPLRVRMSGAPSVGDLGEVIYDVVGFADDSVKGLRLHVFGRPMAAGEGFSLVSVEATSLCARGVTGNGLCI